MSKILKRKYKDSPLSKMDEEEAWCLRVLFYRLCFFINQKLFIW